MNTTEPRSPEFMEGYRTYRAGDTLMHCPFDTLADYSDSDSKKFSGWYAAWQDYQDRLHQFGE